MAKIKAPKRAVADFILKPNRLRLFLIYLLMFVLALILGYGIRWIFYRDTFTQEFLQNQGAGTALLIIGGALLLSFTEYSRWTLRIINRNVLEGPTGMFGDRLRMPIETIDWKRTQRSLASRFKIGNAIYGEDRQRILVSPWFFNSGQFSELLELIGYEGE
jgi:hypothetical protein